MSQSSGVFLVLEGADGSGKTTLLGAIRNVVEASGRTVVVPTRAGSGGAPTFADLSSAIGRFYAAGNEDRLPTDLLLTAAATQYQAIYYGQVQPALDEGKVVLTDGWWNKTWARLYVERRLTGLPSGESASYLEWARGIYDFDRLGDRRIVTALIHTSEDVRREWYASKPDREVVFDSNGADSTDPSVFGDFTERIQDLLIAEAEKRRWNTFENGPLVDPTNLAEHIWRSASTLSPEVA